MAAWTLRPVRHTVALYLVALGACLGILAVQRAPADFAISIRGVLFGAVLIHGAAPFLDDDRDAVLADLGRFVITLLTFLITTYPRALLLPLIPITFLPAFAPTLAFIVVSGLIVTMVEVARTIWRLLMALTTSFERASALKTLGAAVTGVAVVLPMLVLTPRWDWVDPPLSLPASVAGALVLLAIVVAAVRDALEPAPELEPLRPNRPRGTTLGLSVAALLLWVAGADRLFPNGVWPSTVTVISSDPADSERVHGFLRAVETRMGLHATGERFVVRIGPGVVPAPNQSIVEFMPNGEIEVRLNTGLPADRVHNYLSVQFARTIAGIRLNTVDPAILDGFAYWASENTHNPFYSGSNGETSARAACAAAPTIDFRTRDPFFYYADASLPFMRAELTGGIDAARERLLDLIDSTTASDPLDGPVQDLRTAVIGDCQWYQIAYPPPPELFVEQLPGRTAQLDVAQIQTIVNAMSERTGLDGLGHHFLVRYVNTIPGGHAVDFDGSDPRQAVIVILANLDLSDQFTYLRWEFAAAFVGGIYGGPSVVQRGFAEWAAQDPHNPTTHDAAATRRLCATVPPSEIVASQTNNAVYLDSLPFVQAEKQGGQGAAQQLMREAIAQPNLAQSWAERVSRACSAVP